MAVADAILKSMRPVINGAPDSRNIFFLTPGGDRVSFYAQQARALNLVWALSSKQLLSRKASDGEPGADSAAALDIAVVGAGVAGVMVSCSLAALGHKVNVFDRAASPLWRQIATRHRVVHPMLNQWAAHNAANVLSPITDLPFLNWHYAFCDDAVSAMLEDFRAFEAEAGLTFRGNVEIKDFSTASDSFRIELSADHGPVGDFDLVVFCTGFMRERGYNARAKTPDAVRKSAPSNFQVEEYWSGDDLERNKAEGRYRNYVVSGGGDGGLVDVLRLAYDYQYGGFAFRFARLMSLHLPDLVDLLFAQETNQRRERNSSAYQHAADVIATEGRAEPVRKLLDAALRWPNGAPPKIYLADERGYDAPCKSKAAPVHKLLATYAIKKGRVIYAGKVPAGLPKNWESFSLNDDQLRRENTLVILRHGADSRLVLDGAPAKDLRERHRTSNEFSWWKVYPEDELKFKNLPPMHDPAKSEFWEHRARLLQRALRQIDDDAFAFVEGDDLHVDAPNCDEIPEKLFGVRIVRSRGARPKQIPAME